MAFIIPFSIVSMDYVEASATEFVPEIPRFDSIGTGFLSLMAICGFIPEVAYLGTFTGIATLGAYTVTQFTAYASDEFDLPVSTINNFLDGVQRGLIDKTSSAWGVFKQFLSTLDTESTGTDVTKFKHIMTGSSYYVSDTRTLWVSCGLTGDSTLQRDTYFYIQSPTGGIMDSDNHIVFVSMDESVKTVSVTAYTNDRQYSTRLTGSGINLISKTLNNGAVIRVAEELFYTGLRLPVTSSSRDYTSLYEVVSNNIVVAPSPADSLEQVFGGISSPADWQYLGGSIADSIPDLSDLPLSGANSIAENLTNVLEKAGSLSDAVEQVIEGSISISDYRDMVGVYPVEDDKVITPDGAVDIPDYVPNPSYAPEKPVVPDKPEYNEYEFTVQGLKEVFPFCIPFDLVDFIGILKAEGKAPKWELSASFLGSRFSHHKITVDLAPYDPMAKIIRKTELFLFIVALILITRHIIKG